jgi:leucyl-tRNA synthetase
VIDGLSERGNHPVIRQPLRQWVLKIPKYGERLEKELESLEWPEGTLTAQKQWIGRSQGSSVKFQTETGETVEVFTTRPDTLQGVTYVVLAPEHPLVDKLTTDEYRERVASYRKTVASKSDLERTSVGKDRGKTGEFLGTYVIHPLTGAKVPIWTADYVLYGYGTGAVMAVPAHDERDFAFAAKFNLEVKQVIQPNNSPEKPIELPYLEDGVLINSGEFDQLDSQTARTTITKKLESLNRGSIKITFKLRDWVFSRQRYWGEPIPIYFPVDMLPDSEGRTSPIEGAPHTIRYDQPIPVDDSELPLKLPEMTDFHPGDDPQGCLARAKSWRYFQKDGKWYARETNTMPQVSYYLI